MDLRKIEKNRDRNLFSGVITAARRYIEKAWHNMIPSPSCHSVLDTESSSFR